MDRQAGLYGKIIDSVNEGIIAIDGNGEIKCYNRKAREIFGISSIQGVGHASGKLEEGDIVVIADNSLGTDDGGLTAEDLRCIGISTSIPRGSAFVAVGILGGEMQGRIAYLENPEGADKLQEQCEIKGHKLRVWIDLMQQTAMIVIDGQSFAYSFLKSIGHMAAVCAETGRIKFYQSAGYTARREDIKSLLQGKAYQAKGEGALEMDVLGRSIFDVHPREFNINIIEFLEAAKGKEIAYSKEVKEINGYLTRCSLILVREEGEAAGAILKVEDITELKNVIEERDNAIAALNAVRSRMKHSEEDAFKEITGQSESIRMVKRLAAKAAESDSTVLLLGESGTGKGLVAECIHKNGKRKKGPFIYVNCAAIPENLLESEFFGYEGGAFTGARKDGKAGLFEAADDGTIFLDEIGDMPPFFQVKLLHVLQSRNIRRVGGIRDIRTDVRIIAATNRDLEAAVADGSFRKDLFYRISVFPIYIPPLRLRREDIFLLIHDLLPKICIRVGCNEKRISGEAIRLLTDKAWSGNVRELENALERAVNMAEGGILLKEHFNLKQERGVNPSYCGVTLSAVLEQAERNAIAEALRISEGNKAEAMKLLDIGKTGFYEKLKKYRL